LIIWKDGRKFETTDETDDPDINSCCGLLCYDHNLTVPGKYTVYAYYTISSEHYLREMLKQKEPKQDDFEPEPRLWYGMAVSDPLEIEIPLNPKQPN
jgi:hypothetical protein